MSDTTIPDTDDRITVGECDCCGHRHVPMVLYHCHGTPVFGECNRCNPVAFAKFAAREAAVNRNLTAAVA